MPPEQIPPNTPATVTLTAQDWTTLLNILARQTLEPWCVCNPIIQSVYAQVGAEAERRTQPEPENGINHAELESAPEPTFGSPPWR